jgi:hypothetical protein
MSAENLCVSKDTAIKLRDAGFPQGDSCFVWAEANGGKIFLFMRHQIMPENRKNAIAAPTTDEILAQPEIPDDTFLEKHIDATGTKYEMASLSLNIEDCGETSPVETAAWFWLKVRGK